MTRCPVMQDELDHGTQKGRWSQFTAARCLSELLEEVEIEKRSDGTYICNPSLKDFINGAKFGEGK